MIQHFEQRLTAVEILRYLLHRYAPESPTDTDIEELARILESFGAR